MWHPKNGDDNTPRAGDVETLGGDLEPRYIVRFEKNGMKIFQNLYENLFRIEVESKAPGSLFRS